MMSAAKRTLHGLYVPIMAATVYAIVYGALSFVMLNPYLMLAMVPIGAYQNLQAKVWHDRQKRSVRDCWIRRCQTVPPRS